MYALILAPVLSLFFFMMGNALLTTLLSLRALELTNSHYMPALIAAAFFMGIVVGSNKAIMYVQRVGHIRAFCTFAAIAAIICLLHGMFLLPWAWVGLRFLGGFACAGLFLVVESWLLALSDASSRGRLLAVYMCTFYFAQSFGQILLEIIDWHLLQAFCCVTILIALSILPVSFTRRPSPNIEEPTTLSFKSLYRLSPLSIIGCIIAGMIVSSLYSLAPVYARQINMAIDQIGWFMGLLIFGGALLQWPIGRLSDFWGRRLVMMLVSSLGVVISVGFILMDHNDVISLYLMAILLGGFVFTLYPLSISHAADFLTTDKIVAATGGLLIANSIGAVLGPLAGGAVMHYYETDGLFIYIAVSCSLLSLFTIWRSQQRAAVPIDEQVDYVAVPRTTPLASELDPRAEVDV